MLGNDNFDTFFSNSLISNCNILAYAQEGGLLFDREHIANFTMTRENECALSFVPNDTAVIELIKWDTLDEDVKNFLSKPTSYDFQNFVWLIFQVNGETTTYGICFAVEKIEVNTKKWRAKLTLCSPFRTKTMVIQNWGYDDFDTFPNQATNFEALQHEAVNLGKGLIIRNDQDYYWNDFGFVDDINRFIVDVYFNDKNVIEDIVESEDENDRSGITFVGIKPKTETTLYMETKAPEWDFWHEHLELSFSFNFEGKQYVASTITVTITHAGSDVTNLFDIVKYNDHILVKNKSGASLSQVNYVLEIKGYEAELDEPTTENYVKSLTWVTGSQGLADAQAKTREYYSHKKYIEFSCRLDPRIEPLDNIFIYGVGVIKVEKVTMRFNGAFKGNIKGRLLQDMTLKAPVVSDVGWYPQSSPNSFHFNITNNNPTDVLVHIVASDGSYEYEFPIPKYETLTVTQVNAPNLMGSFDEKAQQNLNDAVYCFFRVPVGEWERSDNSIILEEDW